MVSKNSSSEDKYRLKWESTTKPVDLQDIFQTLRNNEELFDVSLGCSTKDGGTVQVMAHKLVLSAYSPVMKDLMTHLQGKNEPFVYLKGISQENLSCILDFVYNGCVDIPKSNLNQFLEDAQELQIKGLKVSNEEEENRSTADSLTNNIKSKSKIQKDSIKRELENLISSRLRDTTGKSRIKYSAEKDDDPDYKNYKVTRPKKKVKNDEETLSNLSSNVHEEAVHDQLKLKKIDELKENHDENLDDSNAMDQSVAVTIEGNFEDVKGKSVVSGNQTRYFVRCKICSKEVRRDRKKMHWDNNHRNLNDTA